MKKYFKNEIVIEKLDDETFFFLIQEKLAILNESALRIYEACLGVSIEELCQVIYSANQPDPEACEKTIQDVITQLILLDAVSVLDAEA